MKLSLSVTEVARNFSDYINRVAYRGESFVLVRGKQPVAELRPLPTGRRLAELTALLASVPRLSETEAAEFADDLSAARQSMADFEPSDPWQS